MADGTRIEWTEATWNPITGCSVLTAGCRYCYAMVLAGTRMQHHWSREGLTQPTANGPVWNGQVRFNREWLGQPLAWARPRMIFVNAHGDTFHDAVEDAWLDVIYAIAALTPRHTYQVLTKRSGRMRAYYAGLDTDGGIGRVARFAAAMATIEAATGRKLGSVPFVPHPLPNIWAGVSAENQAAWDERVKDLSWCNAAVRWVSAEPLLGPIVGGELLRNVDWLVAGGESDRLGRARPMHPEWPSALRDECAAAGTAFFFKQWGDWAPVCAMSEELIDSCYHPAPESRPEATRRRKVDQCVLHADGERIDGRAMYERGAFLQGKGAMTMMAVGKARAGRLLAGVQHDGVPA